MSLQEKNRYLQILHKNGVSRDRISFIMKDLEQSGIFQDSEDSEFDEFWEEIDQRASIIFGDMESSDKKKCLTMIDKKEAETCQLKEIINNRIKQKQEEIEATGNCFVRRRTQRYDLNNGSNNLPYGRTYLHEAIAMKDLESIEEYVKEGLYLDEKDNNGHIPIEMAYYLNYRDAIKIFEKYAKNKHILK